MLGSEHAQSSGGGDGPGGGDGLGGGLGLPGGGEGGEGGEGGRLASRLRPVVSLSQLAYDETRVYTPLRRGRRAC